MSTPIVPLAPGLAECLTLARADCAHLPARPGRSWRCRVEADVDFRGWPVTCLGDGHRDLLVAFLPEGAAIAP